MKNNLYLLSSILLSIAFSACSDHDDNNKKNCQKINDRQDKINLCR